MRTLLLLVMACLLPLQLFAATLGSMPPAATATADIVVTAHGSYRAGDACGVQTAPAVSADAGLSLLQAVAEQGFSGEGMPGDDDGERSASSSQSEVEDQTLPGRVATLNVPWLPFPHAFPAPLLRVSFVRDQLRPPPLA